MVWTLLASDPACSSVSANAASFSPLAIEREPAGLLFRRPEQDQGPEPDRVVGIDEYGRGGAMAADDFHDPAVTHLREATAPELHGCGHAEDPELGQSLDHRGRDIRLAIDGGGVNVGVRERLDLRDRLLDSRPFVLGQVGVGEERIAPELAPEQRLGEPTGRRTREEQFLRLTDLLGPQSLVVSRRRGTVGCRGRYRHGCGLLPRFRDRNREPRGTISIPLREL